MCVDVADRLRRESGVRKRRAHRTHLATDSGLREVVAVARCAEADDLGNRLHASGAHCVRRLEHQCGGPFSKYEAAPVLRERAA